MPPQTGTHASRRPEGTDRPKTDPIKPPDQFTPLRRSFFSAALRCLGRKRGPVRAQLSAASALQLGEQPLLVGLLSALRWNGGQALTSFFLESARRAPSAWRAFYSQAWRLFAFLAAARVWAFQHFPVPWMISARAPPACRDFRIFRHGASTLPASAASWRRQAVGLTINEHRVGLTRHCIPIPYENAGSGPARHLASPCSLRNFG